MSGTAFLEEIVTWDDETRAEKVEEALPRLILCLENYKSYDEAVGILQILCQSFVPVVQQDQLEDRVFCPVSPQICQLLDSVVEEVHEAIREDEDIDTDHLITLLQHVVNVAQCVEDCLKRMTMMAGLQSAHVRSLLTSSFHILKDLTLIVRKVAACTEDLLPALSDTLSLMFRTAHSLQMVLLNMLDKLVTTQTMSEEALQDIAQACTDLWAVCRIVACLDLKLTISLWKALSRLAGPQAEVLHGRMDVSGMVTYLSQEVLTGITRLLQSAPPPHPDPGAQESLSQGDEKMFQKSVRILGFQMKVLVALVRDFHSYLADCAASLYTLLLSLNSILPPSLSAPRLQKKHEDDLRQQLCNAAQPLLSHLLTNASFTHHVLNTQDREPRTALARLLLCVMVMDGVAQASGDIVSKWLNASSSSSLVKDQADSNLMLVVFSTLPMCHVEVCLPVYLPGPPCEGKPHRSVSLYQYVVEHVSAFIASCPATCFHIVEKSLLEVLLGSNPISSQAAADCWCFLARYGTADLCWQQTQQVLSLLLHVQTDAPHCTAAYRPLTSLFARLVKFLSPQHQTELVRRLASAPHLWVLGEVGGSVFSGSAGQQGCGLLVPVCLSALNTLCLSPHPSLTQAAAVIPAMQCLHAVLQGDTGAERLTPQQGAALLERVPALWEAALPASSAVVLDVCHSDSRMRHAYLSALLLLTSDFAEQLDVRLILQILLLSHKIMKDSASRGLTLAVLQLMQSLGRLKCPQSVEQGQVLGKISDTFAAALTHPSAVVQFSALAAFTRFAEQTPYEAIVPQCLAQHPGLQDTVAAYLQKTPPTGEESFSTVSFLQHQQRQLEAGPPCQAPNPESAPRETSEPDPKRQKVDHAKSPEQFPDTAYQNTLEELERLTQRMEKLQADSPPPDWVKAKGRSLLHRLSVCLDHR